MVIFILFLIGLDLKAKAVYGLVQDGSFIKVDLVLTFRSTLATNLPIKTE